MDVPDRIVQLGFFILIRVSRDMLIIFVDHFRNDVEIKLLRDTRPDELEQRERFLRRVSQPVFD